MIDRHEIFHRWHSLALIIGTRAAGRTQNLQPDTISGTHAVKSQPSAQDWIERRELQGGMLRWLADMNGRGENVIEAMHEAIVRARPGEIQRLLGSIERAEWLLKQVWEGSHHRKMRPSESDRYGREALEQTIVMRYRGVHTQAAADDAGMSVHSLRWIRRKHGLSITGERMYPCTTIAGESCAVCSGLTSSSDYDEMEAA